MITKNKFREFISTATYYEKSEWGLYQIVNKFGVMSIHENYLNEDMMKSIRSIGLGKYPWDESNKKLYKQLIAGQVNEVSDTGFAIWYGFYPEKPSWRKIFKVCGSYMMVNEDLFYGIKPAMDLRGNEDGITYSDGECEIFALRMHMPKKQFHDMEVLLEGIQKGEYYE